MHSQTHRFALALLGAAAATALVTITGCAPMSTYPPVETAAATKLTRPTFEPVPTVMAEAIRYVQERHLKGQDVAINLPEGAPHEAYEMVFARLGCGRPMMSPHEPAIHVQEVRTRMFNAQVDLVYPQGAIGMNQMMTLTLNRTATSNFKVTGERMWHLRSTASAGPNYVPPTLPPSPSSAPQPDEMEAPEPVKAAAIVPEK